MQNKRKRKRYDFSIANKLDFSKFEKHYKLTLLKQKHEKRTNSSPVP
jgi:hypothetical protein